MRDVWLDGITLDRMESKSSIPFTSQVGYLETVFECQYHIHTNTPFGWQENRLKWMDIMPNDQITRKKFRGKKLQCGKILEIQTQSLENSR